MAWNIRLTRGEFYVRNRWFFDVLVAVAVVVATLGKRETLFYDPDSVLRSELGKFSI